ncbi:MAG TPA: hypothetical protein DCF87_09630, partial [Opitutae bacterium]|nr:hypothetical protein [Opitutae bacterium]
SFERDVIVDPQRDFTSFCWRSLLDGIQEKSKELELLRYPPMHSFQKNWQAAWFWNENAVNRISWTEWDQLILDSNKPSIFLDSRMVRALLNSSSRNVAAVEWRCKDVLKGIALVEDTHAESVDLSKHVDGKSFIFNAISRLLHGRSGRLEFSVRVMGTTLGSGDHAFRFLPDVDAEQRKLCVEGTMYFSSSDTGTKIPGVVMVKDTTIPEKGQKSPVFPGWTPIEFDPEMVVYVDPSWNSIEDCMPFLMKKSRTKFKRIQELSKDFKVERWSLNQLEKEGDLLIELYRSVFDRSGFRLGSLHLEELIESKRLWGDAFVVDVYVLDGENVGFQCAYVTPEATEAFFVGFRPKLIKSHAIYQRMLLEFIRMGILAGCEEVRMGRTALDVKSSIGALPRRLQCDVKFRNPLFHFIVQVFSTRFSPMPPDLKRAWQGSSYPLQRHLELNAVELP